MMIVHNGRRYRPEDAKRLGIPIPDPATSEGKPAAPNRPSAAENADAPEDEEPAQKKKTRKTARNKARTVESEGSGGPA